MSLRRGQRFRMAGKRWRVIYVNDSRAHCEAVVREPRTVPDRRTGGTRTFTATRRITIDIAPSSCVELLAEAAMERSW